MKLDALTATRPTNSGGFLARFGRRRTLLAMAALTIFITALSGCGASSKPATVYGITASPLPISGVSPFPSDNCGSSTAPYRSSEVEPSVAVNPTDAGNVLSIYQQDRFTSLGSLSDVVSVTNNGGLNWKQVLLPDISKCTGGSNQRATDPWVSFGPDGKAYAMTLSLTPSGVPNNPNNATIQVSTSTDGGFAWSRPIPIVISNANANLVDKGSITADPYNAGTAYATWHRFAPSAGTDIGIYFSSTTDGGKTWSTPQSIDTPPPGTIGFGGVIHVLPDRQLINVFTLIHTLDFEEPSNALRGSWQAQAQYSNDGGKTWSPPVTIASFPAYFPIPSNGKTQVRGFPTVTSAVAPNGTIYAAWQNNQSGTRSEIDFSKSNDGGLTWSTPGALVRLRSQSFQPTMAIDQYGTIGVTYYTVAPNLSSNGHNWPADYWFARSRNDGRQWTIEQIADPFNILTAVDEPGTEDTGLFLGDYQGLAALPTGGFVAVFAMSQPAATHGPSDIFFERLPD